MNETASLMEWMSPGWRILAYAAIAGLTHLLVLFIKRLVARYVRESGNRKNRKLRSIATVMTSALVFTLYFLVLGLIVEELFPNFEWTTYFASASVIALAIGFGSQGIVQDVVTGLTLIFSDLIDVGDLVEISGQAGTASGGAAAGGKHHAGLGAERPAATAASSACSM